MMVQPETIQLPIISAAGMGPRHPCYMSLPVVTTDVSSLTIYAIHIVLLIQKFAKTTDSRSFRVANKYFRDRSSTNRTAFFITETHVPVGDVSRRSNIRSIVLVVECYVNSSSVWYFLNRE